LGKDIEKYKSKKVSTQPNSVGFDRINELESKLKLVERENAELVAEEASLQRI